MLSRIVPFRMHSTGWFVVLFCALLGFRLDGWRFALPVGALLVISLLLHEVGHMLAATLLRVPVREFGLRLGGAYNRRAYATRRRDELFISVAGPLTNLALVVPFLFLHRFGAQLAACNLLLGIINLIPLPSSDGLRILRTLRHSGAPIDMAQALNPSRSHSTP